MKPSPSVMQHVEGIGPTDINPTALLFNDLSGYRPQPTLRLLIIAGVLRPSRSALRTVRTGDFMKPPDFVANVAARLPDNPIVARHLPEFAVLVLDVTAIGPDQKANDASGSTSNRGTEPSGGRTTGCRAN
jgi:hypothetical protein